MFQPDWIRLVLRRVHEPRMWLVKGRVTPITKEDLRRVHGYNDKGEALTLRTIANAEVTRLTKSRSDSWLMTVNDIKDDGVQFASTVISDKVYQSSNLNSVLGGAIHAAHRIMHDNGQYDICAMFRGWIFENLKKLGLVKKKFIKFGTLLVCLFFYYQSFFPSIGKVTWQEDKLDMIQIGELANNLGN